MEFRRGDRVRIRNPRSEYTGCRGTIAEERADGIVALGHWVAIDGENGVARPFLVDDLELLQVARVRSRRTTGRRSRGEGSGPAASE
ncbi:MAG: hypothetical protein JRF61_17315 [Deltaproteobacteria bacterium]|jgi:hypothetical protein|nr:hypothetical protein [Deltaproteobacteria bacterium]